MVNHWLNWNSDTENVIVSSSTSLVIGSQPKDGLFSVDQKLSSNTPLSEVLQHNPPTLITFKSLMEIKYVRNTTSVLVRYQGRKKIETLEIDLGSREKAEELFDHVSQYVAETMVKRIGTNARLYGLVIVISSVLFSAVFLYSFFNVQRLLAWLLPLICVLGTIGYVIREEKLQRAITRWTTDSEVRTIGTTSFRALGACAIFSVLSLCVSPFFHDNYGQQALFQAAKRGSLEANQITGYLDRGSSINHEDDDGTTVLWWSIENLDESVSIALLENGADIRANEGRLLEHAIKHQADQALLRLMLQRGALEVAELIADFETRNYLKKKDDSFTKAFHWHRRTY